MKRLALPKSGCCIAMLAAMLWLVAEAPALAQQGEPKGESKGENFSAKPPAQLFASDCTGAGCHKGPQGLAKAGGIGLAGFLREHYTNSRESAAALASYLAKLPNTPEPKEKTRERTARPAAAPSGPGERAGFSSSVEPGSVTRPEPREARTPAKPNTRTSRAPAKPEEEAPAARSHSAITEPGEKPAPAARPGQPGHPAAAATAAAPEVVPTPPPAPTAQVQTPPPPSPQPAAPPKPAPKQFDIFD